MRVHAVAADCWIELTTGPSPARSRRQRARQQTFGESLERSTRASWAPAKTSCSQFGGARVASHPTTADTASKSATYDEAVPKPNIDGRQGGRKAAGLDPRRLSPQLQDADCLLSHSLIQLASSAQFQVLVTNSLASSRRKNGLSQGVINNSALTALRKLRSRNHGALSFRDCSHLSTGMLAPIHPTSA